MAGDTTYNSAVPPNMELATGITQFFRDFYKMSDTPGSIGEWADFFTDDATLVMASKRGVGREEIMEIRKGMWAAVASRLHSPQKIFPFGNNANEVMLFGTVAFRLKDERKAEVDWAGRAILVQVEGNWKMKFYQVYLDTAATANAK